MRRWWSSVVVVLVALALLVWVGVVTLTLRVSEQTLTSPSGRFLAGAATQERPRFFGGTETTERLWVEDALGRTLWEVQLVQDPPVDWVAGGRLTWADDSSSVTFTAARPDGGDVTVRSLQLEAQPTLDEALEP